VLDGVVVAAVFDGVLDAAVVPATEAEIDDAREDSAEAGIEEMVDMLCCVDVTGTVYVLPLMTAIDGQVRVAMSMREVDG